MDEEVKELTRLNNEVEEEPADDTAARSGATVRAEPAEGLESSKVGKKRRGSRVRRQSLDGASEQAERRHRRLQEKEGGSKKKEVQQKKQQQATPSAENPRFTPNPAERGVFSCCWLNTQRHTRSLCERCRSDTVRLLRLMVREQKRTQTSNTSSSSCSFCHLLLVLLLFIQSANNTKTQQRKMQEQMLLFSFLLLFNDPPACCWEVSPLSCPSVSD
ncbi:hypothetical protein Q8A73_000086 [Channa argus]|nr:hypothetical protein Q8A73_000086 [Channa argus]